MQKLSSLRSIYKLTCVLGLLLVCMHSANAQEEFPYDRVSYRCTPLSSTIILESVDSSKIRNYPKGEIVFTAHKAHQSTVHRETVKLDGHTFVTTIEMWEPSITGFGGAYPRWTLRINCDGKGLYDAFFGHSHYLDMNITKIVVDEKSRKLKLEWFSETVANSQPQNTEINFDQGLISDEKIRKLKNSSS